MSQDKPLRPKGEGGIMVKEDIEPHPKYIETITTKKPKVKVTRAVNRQREVKIGSSS